MIKKIKIALISLTSLFVLAVPAIAAADSPQISNSLCGGANTLQLNDTPGDCSAVGAGSTSRFNDTLRKIINIFSVIVGVIAVIMIVVGGFRYITSGGQAEKVTAAKNTILYALVGLVIVALAQIIVKFILSKATAT